MSVSDEELLLLNPADNDHLDNITTYDEEALLGGGDKTLDPADSGADNQVNSASLSEQKSDDEEELFGTEELDYDEDDDEEEEKRERTSRYASEKRGETEVKHEENKSEENNAPNSDSNVKNGKSRKDIPSLFDKNIKNPKIGTNSTSSGQHIAVRLKLEGGPEQVFLPRPNVVPVFNPTPIVPRLPNGIPLVSLPSNHGCAGFGPSYASNPLLNRMAGGGGGPAQWDQAVASFLHGSKSSSSHISSKRRRRERSSSSSSYSSYSSRSSSRSRSRSPKRRRDKRRGGERRDDARRDSRRKNDYRQKRSYENTDRKRSSRDQKNTTIESAKALGLTDEYLQKVNEQKRKREEILKKKEERRYGSEKVVEEKKPEVIATSSSVSQNDREKKTKAYLVVNAQGLKQLPTAVKRIEKMATELGPIKKCWRSSDDIVSIIFTAHDKAKDFLMKYNNKVLSGLRITIALEKKYLNLSDIS